MRSASARERGSRSWRGEIAVRIAASKRSPLTPSLRGRGCRLFAGLSKKGSLSRREREPFFDRPAKSRHPLPLREGVRGDLLEAAMRTAISPLQLLEPRSLAEALRMLRDEGGLVPLAGCTDVYVNLNFGILPQKRFLNLWRLEELRRIEMRGGLLSIGALATHTRMIRSP